MPATRPPTRQSCDARTGPIIMQTAHWPVNQRATGDKEDKVSKVRKNHT